MSFTSAEPVKALPLSRRPAILTVILLDVPPALVPVLRDTENSRKPRFALAMNSGSLTLSSWYLLSSSSVTLVSSGSNSAVSLGNKKLTMTEIRSLPGQDGSARLAVGPKPSN